MQPKIEVLLGLLFTNRAKPQKFKPDIHYKTEY